MRHLKKLNDKLHIVVLGGYINTSRACSELYNRFRSFDACKDPQFVSFNPFGEQQKSRITEADDIDYLYIDKTRLLCPHGTLASCLVEANGEPAFYDQHHLSLGFASYLGKRISKIYGEELTRAGFPDPALSNQIAFQPE